MPAYELLQIISSTNCWIDHLEMVLTLQHIEHGITNPIVERVTIEIIKHNRMTLEADISLVVSA